MSSLLLIPGPYQQIKPMIELAFMGDEYLLSKFTPIPNDTLENCVNRCYANIEEVFTGAVYVDSEKKSYLVAIIEEGVLTPIGYTITAKSPDVPNELYSFGINIKYRTKDNVLHWLEEVRRLLGDYYWLSLYRQNERAIRFFERNGFTKFTDETSHCVSLCNNFNKFKKKSLCQLQSD